MANFVQLGREKAQDLLLVQTGHQRYNPFSRCGVRGKCIRGFPKEIVEMVHLKNDKIPSIVQPRQSPLENGSDM